MSFSVCLDSYAARIPYIATNSLQTFSTDLQKSVTGMMMRAGFGGITDS